MFFISFGARKLKHAKLDPVLYYTIVKATSLLLANESYSLLQGYRVLVSRNLSGRFCRI